MRIALFGYGKMGQMIEQIALSRGHEIVAKIDENTNQIDFTTMDVAIDFSMPEAAFGNITKCLNHNIPIICGTTGWLDKYNEAIELCNSKKGAFIYASNFSLGVNIFFELNNYLAKMMKNLPEYKVSLEEIHHTQKLDAPSGTAITLAEGVIANSEYNEWKLEDDSDGALSITSKRIGNTPGTHTLLYENEVDSIEIKHTAHNREGFALGAVTAAEWIIGKRGVFSMRDVLNLG
ncbi:4-hydroxy-tetrahydrodipicolinate reductase [Maribacter hydrothermalis]|uniref:4-hydroxy-tetrahydrodipicolinate reductase n=1 Tax=Maribacter hydrothermalis TaxID=1836467 RepID=A0A1B7ZDA7_9FLAO|nr:4-hydroxy-tetrahydrodipicolinate reductase [Maribacter hydrothermalis]APQ18455.1 4-hydroxy-tetrahydrodipicolinate reductase [Maribacter hydrothermalis]OBR41338.1 4-hydroxy-tetrahydrodipicolinate reductase [Maribacter hydrothermalis]